MDSDFAVRTPAMIATDTTVESKRCPFCCKVKPLTEFRRRKRGCEKRQSECDDCRNLHDQRRRAEKRFKRDGDEIAANNRALKGAANIEQVMYLQGRMIGLFGGLEDFAAAQEEQAKVEMKKNLGGQRSSDVFASVTRIYALGRQANSIDLTGLDTKDAVGKITKFLLTISKTSPAEVKAGMSAAGWPDAGATAGGQDNGHAER